MKREFVTAPHSAKDRAAWRFAAAASVVVLAAGCVGTPNASLGARPESRAIPTADPESLVWALSSEPTSLDAAQLANDQAGTQVAAQIYDRLLRFRPGTAELAPGILTDWSADPDGRIFTFTLRDGLEFHDGTRLDAAAVVWNFERWMDPQHPAHHGKFVAYRDYFGGFVGQKDAEGRAINLVAEVTAMDPETVRVTLNAPFAPFLRHLAMVPFGLASPAAVRSQGEDYGSDGEHLPVGSGAFKAVGWFSDGTILLEPNEDYWAGPPAASAMRFVVVPDTSDRARAVANGAVHGADLPPTTAITGSLTAQTIEVVARPPRSTAWLMLNHTRNPLGEEVVRRALSMAIDRERLAREQFGPLSQPANQLLPPGFSGHETEIEPTPYDTAAARRLLEENGYSEGFKLNIWVANTARGYLPDPTGAAASVAEMLQEIGIDARVRSENLRQFLMDRDRGRFTAWLIGWEAQSADPDNMWYWHFGAGRVAAEGQYDNPDLRRSLLDAQRNTNSAEREEIYRAAARIVDADVPRIYLAHVCPIVAVSRWVEGYSPSPMGFDDFKEVSLRPGAEPAPDFTVPSTPTAPAAGYEGPAPVGPTPMLAEPLDEGESTGDDEAGTIDAAEEGTEGSEAGDEEEESGGAGEEEGTAGSDDATEEDAGEAGSEDEAEAEESDGAGDEDVPAQESDGPSGSRAAPGDAAQPN